MTFLAATVNEVLVEVPGNSVCMCVCGGRGYKSWLRLLSDEVLVLMPLVLDVSDGCVSECVVSRDFGWRCVSWCALSRWSLVEPTSFSWVIPSHVLAKVPSG